MTDWSLYSTKPKYTDKPFILDSPIIVRTQNNVRLMHALYRNGYTSAGEFGIMDWNKLGTDVKSGKIWNAEGIGPRFVPIICEWLTAWEKLP